MTVTTSLRCDHGRPGPDRCTNRVDVDMDGVGAAAMRAEARRAGWRVLAIGDVCPGHPKRHRGG